ncbi:MAG: hypothetical protein O3C20_19375 [Verrucomicrobia bacterium]|nr:hypothetical protein [Verrucomicrobiota bacterium]
MWRGYGYKTQTIKNINKDKLYKQREKPWPKKKEVSKETFITAAADMLNGKSIRQVTQEYQMSERDARWLSRNQGLTEKKFQQLVISKSQVILEEALDMLREKLPSMSGSQLAICYGIVQDKLQKITETQNHNLTIQNNSVGIFVEGKKLSRDDLIKLLKPRTKEDPNSMHNPSLPDIIDC